MYKGIKNLAAIPLSKIGVKVLGKGNAVELDAKGAWLLSIIAINGLMATIIQSVLTGDSPKEIKDVVFPRISKADPEARMALPTYLKEFMAIYKSMKDGPFHIPTHWMRGGMNGFLAKSYEIAQNHDYFGTEIRHEDDNLLKQTRDIALHLIPKPFSITTMQRMSEQGYGAPMAFSAGIIGFNKAPNYINQTPAEQLAYKIAKEAAPSLTKTSEEFKHQKLVSQLAYDNKIGKKDRIEKAKVEGKLSTQDLKTIQQKTNEHPLQRVVKRLQWKEAKRVWERATTEEKKLIKAQLKLKWENAVKDAAPEYKEAIKKEGSKMFL